MVKNKTILGVLTLLLGLALTASAENYPYRSDVLWVTVPNHADWLYQTGEKATVEVQFYKYGIPQDGVTVCYELGDDMMPSDTKGSVTLKNGRAVVTIGTMKQPGFRDCRLQATIAGKTYKHHVKVGFSPDKLQPYTKMPADFDEFWDKSKSEIATFPLLYTKERVEKYSTDKIDCYLVKLQLNSRGQSIYGYLTCPRNMQKGACPVVLCPPGAGIKTIKAPLRHKYYAEQGCIRFEMEIHGLNPEMSEAEFKEISNAFNGRENGYLSNGLDNKDNYYMRRVYLACVGTVLSAREVMIIVNGHNKARALYHAVEGPVMQMWTISALQMHEKGIIVCDDAATAELKVGTYRYFKDIEADHLDPESLLK